MSVSFDELIVALEAQPGSGGWYNAKCPVTGHGQGRGDRSKSFGFKRGDFKPVILNCFALCEEEAIVEALEARGLWPVSVEAEQPEAAVNRTLAALDPGLLERMGKLYLELRPIDNTRVDRYLTNRRIKLRCPDQIAYHPSLKHPTAATWWPAMVSVVRTFEGHFISFHRTYLSYKEPVCKAPLEEPRAMLGPLSGYAVHLSPAAEIMCLGEGIETTLSGMQLYRLPGWAALTAGNLPNQILPPIVRKVIILVDDDPPAKGEEIGTGERMAIRAAWRFQREGRQVELIKPEGAKDFNELLQRR